MLRLAPATTSGSAVAFLFRTWCFLRDARSRAPAGGG